MAPARIRTPYGDETAVVKIHSGNGEHEEMDRRAIVCFDQALEDVGLADDGTLRQVLHDYFAWATTTTISRYHRSADDVPNGLRISHWVMEWTRRVRLHGRLGGGPSSSVPKGGITIPRGSLANPEVGRSNQLC